MRRLILGVLFLSAGSALAHGSWSGDRCSGRNFHFDDRDAHVEEQVIDAGALRSLKASVTHAPVTVSGGSGSGYTIKVCKAAAEASDLAQIRVRVDGGELKTSGPDHGDWTVTYVITMPRGGAVDVETKNGPIAVRDVDGNVTVSAKNGPVSLRNVRGTVRAETQNGPISIDGGSGSLSARASNGPLTVRLDGKGWSGELDATTKNGPLSLRIPRGYGSSVVVESNGRGPISCRAEECSRNTAAWDDDRWNAPRRLEFGSGPANVRLSTVNGPVTVRDE
ncbi:MAG TPA: hypothetical protein VFO89_11485 [Thermoanaerobaculia bacterium]|nr:hypothetical protein [Thermoanaerobaculia bacterium]